MADRYWVGGSGNWDATSTANWSTSSGGAAGASAPTSADNVIFDAASNTGTNPFTVTVTGTSSAPAVCNDFSTGGAGGALDGAMTLTIGASGYLDVYGSMTLPATNLSFSTTAGALIQFQATTTGKTITTNGVSFGTSCNIRFSGVGGGWTLGSALTANQIFPNAGTLDTGNYNLTINSIQKSVSTVSTLTLGSSTVSCSGTGPFSYTGSNLTFDAGTSTINCTGTSPTFAGGGLTFYNVIFASGGNGQTTITGANTFNDLSQTSRSATGRRIVQLNDNQTISGTLTLGASNTSIRRIFVVSNVIGTQRTITLNGTLATLADVDFRDIATAGTVGTWTGTRIGNGLNNSGITFDAPKNVYRVGTGNWSATQWSLSSGGSVNANNFPLAQDTAIFDTGTVTGTHTFDQAWLVGTLDCSALNVAVTFATSNLSPTFFKNLILDSDVTLTGTANLLFQGQGTTQTITSAGVSIPQSIIIESPSGTVQLLDNTTTTGAVTLTAGTLDLNDFDLTCFSFSSNNSNTRSIDFGTGEINITGNNGTVWTTATSTNFTYAGTPTVNATYSGSTGTRVINFNGISGATESNVLNLNVTAGSDIISIQNCFKNINLTGFSGTVLAQTTNRIIYGNLTIPNTVTFSATTFANIFSATSGTQQITTNGVTLDFPITIDGVGGTVRLEDNLTVPIGKTFTLTNGTLNINGKVLSVGNFSTSNSNARTIAFGTNGELTVLGVGTTAFNAGTSTNLTITGTNAKINMSGATAKTFAGGGFTYPLTLVQSGLGDLTLTGANTFTNMTNTVQPCTIIFPASTTTSFSNFNINGTAGNLVSLRSSTPGTRCVLAKV